MSKPDSSSPQSSSRAAPRPRSRNLRRLQGLGLPADRPPHLEGEAAYEPRSRRPTSSPTALDPATVDLILQLRAQLATAGLDAGLDAGPDTIAWHLEHHHDTVVSRSTISRRLAKAGLVVPEPSKRPGSSYQRFAASMPNETWQSDFTHYPLIDPTGFPRGVEIITWLDDCTRYALSVTAHRAITTPIVLATFPKATGQHGIPGCTLTDNGMVFTTRLAGTGRQGGRNGFEVRLRAWNVEQKNSRPSHPTTCGKTPGYLFCHHGSRAACSPKSSTRCRLGARRTPPPDRRRRSITHPVRWLFVIPPGAGAGLSESEQ